MLEFWEEGHIFDKLREKNAGHKHWSFIDGPITANNPMGVHHAWGRTYKDIFQRFKAMQGFEQRYQNGFDCQGLWVEVEVEKELGLNSKREIVEYGLDKFAKACRARVEKYSAIQAEQSKRLGQWMDWDHSYYTMDDTNIEHIWHFLKKCHENGWLYKGQRAMPWCARCGTSLSQHELIDSYRDMTHTSVFLKLPIKEREGEYMLVWTTTPWTLTANVALAVHPDLDYAKVKQADGILYLSAGTVSQARRRVRSARYGQGQRTRRPPLPGPVLRSARSAGDRYRRSSRGTTSVRRKASASSTSLPDAARRTTSCLRSSACRCSFRSTRTATTTRDYGWLAEQVGRRSRADDLRGSREEGHSLQD